MAKYIVSTEEIIATHRSKLFEADSEDEARKLAEDEDWRTWGEPDSKDCVSCEIRDIRLDVECLDR